MSCIKIAFYLEIRHIIQTVIECVLHTIEHAIGMIKMTIL